MSQSAGHVATSSPSKTPLSPSGFSDAPSPSNFHTPGTAFAYDTSPSRPTTSPDDSIVIEELSDTDYPADAQILYPYELEEAETSSDSDSTNGNRYPDPTMAQRSRRLRCKYNSTFAPSSPFCPDSRKRSRASTLESDTDSELETKNASSEPPRLRRRIARGPSPTFSVASEASEASSMQTRPYWATEDPMDIDVQTAPAI